MLNPQSVYNPTAKEETGLGSCHYEAYILGLHASWNLYNRKLKMDHLIFLSDWDIIWVVSHLTMGENLYFFPRLDEIVMSWKPKEKFWF